VDKDPIGLGRDGKPVYLRDIWPTAEEMNEALGAAADTSCTCRTTAAISRARPPSGWRSPRPRPGVPVDPKSTYIREPPYFDGFAPRPDQRTGIRAARALAIFGTPWP